MTLLKSIADCQQLQAEIGPQVGKECKDSYDEKNICNGTKIDCVKKGKEKCMSDRKCYGIMYNWWWAKKEKGVKICTSWTLQERPGKDWSVYLKYQFQHEIAPEDGKYCNDHYDKKEICDGNKIDCVKKGKEICLSDSTCYGIMFDSNGWAHNGVKICTSWALRAKPEKDWSVFLKCSLGKLHIIYICSTY